MRKQQSKPHYDGNTFWKQKIIRKQIQHTYKTVAGSGIGEAAATFPWPKVGAGHR